MYRIRRFAYNILILDCGMGRYLPLQQYQVHEIELCMARLPTIKSEYVTSPTFVQLEPWGLRQEQQQQTTRCAVLQHIYMQYSVVAIHTASAPTQQ